MFSRTAEYALRAVCVVARQSDVMKTTDEIAEATKVPPHYLRKVVQSLSRAGLVLTQRGIGGGITLSRSSDEITVLDVVNAVDPIQRIDSCPLGLAEHGVELCPMHSQLDEAIALMENALGSTTIADLLNPKRRKTARCRFPIAGRK